MIAYFTVLSLLVVAYLLNEACIHSADHQREPFAKYYNLELFLLWLFPVIRLYK